MISKHYSRPDILPKLGLVAYLCFGGAEVDALAVAAGGVAARRVQLLDHRQRRVEGALGALEGCSTWTSAEQLLTKMP